MTTMVYEDIPLRRATHYDWANAPQYAQFAAIDADGTAHYFDRRPYADRAIGRWDTRGTGPMSEATVIWIPEGAWTQSLERRP